ncbi:MAG: DUF3488 and transglutaminase-like domain-containing protein [Lachnospiraceae bacterium]|nr:DUF3488 and transglutaminase-like domain-containing protein [Lachnospiraceae bacterium]
MTMEDELYDFLYRSVFTAVIALFVFFEVYDYMDPGVITRGNVFAVILVSIGFNALLLLYRKVRIYMIPAALLVGLILYFLTDREDVVLIIESTVFSVMMICLASFVLFLICDRIIILNLLAVAGAFVYMTVQLILGYGLYRFSPALIIFCLVAVLTRIARNGPADKTGKTEEKPSGSAGGSADGRHRTRLYMTFLLPFLMGFLLLLAVIPKPQDPISWKWVKNLYEYTSEKIEMLMHRLSSRHGFITTASTFRVSFDVSDRMDYDNSGDGRAELFEVTPDATVFGDLYLKGEIFNEYRDGQWYNTLETDRDYSRIDAFESWYGAARYSDGAVNTLIRETGLKIRFVDINSPIVFAPVKMNSFKDISVRKDTEYLNEHLLFSGNASYGSEYNISFLQMNLGNTVFGDYMNKEPEADDISVFETVKKNLRGNYRELTFDELDEYHDYVEKYYTSSPQIRDSVKQWIEEVLKNAGSEKDTPGDYDRLLALEQALSGFKYDLYTDGIPGYVHTEGDFINHFILEKREGFCVHYATAFCLLARYLGYPARVVQGYKTEAPVYETTVIRDGYGHTWPEVYFKGRGWIPFEPTPGMAAERYAGWLVKSGKMKNEDAFRNMHKEEEPLVPEEDKEYEKEHIESKVSGILVFAVFAIIVVSLLMLLAARLLLGKRKIKSMSVQERYYLEFDRMMLSLSQLGIRRDTHETLSEYRVRLDKMLEDESESINRNVAEYALQNARGRLKKSRKATADRDDINTQVFGKCIERHEECLYGGVSPTDKEILRTGRCRVEAAKLLKRRYGRAFVLYRLKMLIMYGF